mmetsp:Transcript_4370/g.12219  ORF Transcript_4370/g.12219 Transcript_4370/m.12219 type:complete len:322 (-) Transcript_4370:83-1048(-)
MSSSLAIKILRYSTSTSPASSTTWRGLVRKLLQVPAQEIHTCLHFSFTSPGECRPGCHSHLPRCFSSSEKDARALSAARKVRAETITAKRAQLDSLLRSNSESSDGDKHSEETEKDQIDKRELAEKALKIRAEERNRLLGEAGFIVRSLYRTCLRSVRVIRPGNARDEADFAKREEKQKREMEEVDISDDSFSIAPPVDRDNELRSRAEYYTEQMREGFSQEIDRLDSDPWREDEVDQFSYLVRSGEDQRKYILKDYRFKDPYARCFYHDQLDAFQIQAKELVADEYEARGWVLQSERENNMESEDDQCEVFGDDNDYTVK